MLSAVRRSLVLALLVCAALLGGLRPACADEAADARKAREQVAGAKKLQAEVVRLIKQSNERMGVRFENFLKGFQPSWPVVSEDMREKDEIHGSLVRGAGDRSIPILLAMAEIKVPSDDELKKTRDLIYRKLINRGEDKKALYRQLDALDKLKREQKEMTDHIQCIGLRALGYLGARVRLAIPYLLTIFDAPIKARARIFPPQWHLALQLIARTGEAGEEVLPEVRKLLRTGPPDDYAGQTMIETISELGVGPLSLAGADIFHAYQHGGPKTRKAAAMAFIAMRRVSVKILRRGLAAGNYKERKAASVAARAHAYWLTSWMRENPKEDMAWALAVLQVLQPHAYEALKLHVVDKQWSARHRADLASVLATHKSTRKKGTKLLVKLLAGEPEVVLAALRAIEALGKRGRSAAFAVRKLSTHESADVQAAAAKTLVTIAPPKKPAK